MIELGRYVWKTKSYDQEVVVVDILGEGDDGRLYVQIEGSNTGIPFDELLSTSQPLPEVS